MTYVTTNIRLDAESYRRLKLQAAERRTSLARLVRDAVNRVYGPAASSSHSARTRKDAFFRMVGACATGRKDGAVHHDRDVYGVKG